MTIVDKAALEAAKKGIRKLATSKGVKSIKDESLEETKEKESELERAYIRHLAFMPSGAAFGDIAFQTNGIRTSTVRTTRTCEMLLVEKDDYRTIMTSEV